MYALDKWKYHRVYTHQCRRAFLVTIFRDFLRKMQRTCEGNLYLYICENIHHQTCEWIANIREGLLFFLWIFMFVGYMCHILHTVNISAGWMCGWWCTLQFRCVFCTSQFFRTLFNTHPLLSLDVVVVVGAHSELISEYVSMVTRNKSRVV